MSRYFYVPGAVLVVTLLFAPPNSHADNCSKILGSRTKRTLLQSIKDYMIQPFSLFSSPKDFKKSISKSGDLYFTVRSGHALKPNCDKNNSDARLNKILYYPAGIVGKKVGEYRSFVYLLLEYGLKVLVPRSSIRKWEGNTNYLFVDSGHRIPYCTKKDCKDPTTPAGKTNLLLTPGSGLLLARYAEHLSTKIEQNGCKIYEIIPVEGEKKLLARANSVFIKDCWKGFKNTLQENGQMKIRIIQKSTFEDLFKRISEADIYGLYGQFSPEMFTRNLLANDKECLDDDSINISATGKVGGNYYIFSASFETKLTRKILMPPGKYFYFSHYSFASKAFGIESAWNCKGSREPQGPDSIRIYLPDKSGTYLLIEPGKIIRLRRSKAFKNLGFWTVETLLNSSRMLQGKYFIACDVVQYFNLRTLLKTHILLQGFLTSKLVSSRRDPVQKKLIVNFFTHLAMASTTDLPTDEACTLYAKVLPDL